MRTCRYIVAGQQAIRAVEAEAAAVVQPPGPTADAAAGSGGGGRGKTRKQAAARPARGAAERLLDLEQRLRDLSAQPQPLQAVYNAARVRALRRGAAASDGGRAGRLDVLPPDESVRSVAGRPAGFAGGSGRYVT